MQRMQMSSLPAYRMNKFQMVTNTLLAIACTLSLTTTSFAEPQNLAQLTHEVMAYHDSGEYQKELTEAIIHARNYVMTRVKTNQKASRPEKLAIILDIDETSLSNYDKMAARHFVANKEQLHKEILAADAPAIQPMLSFYQEALAHGITVFFVTGRKESERQATAKNLKLAGYQQWAGIYLKPENYDKPSIIPFKSQTRAAIANRGYTIIATIGDQFSDLAGGYAEKGFKLPNPYYYLP